MTGSAADPYECDLHFNSHPHEEDDGNQDAEIALQRFSTHILTKRMTAYFTTDEYAEIISTHILTKRMTAAAAAGVWILVFQLTSSRRG